MGVAHHLCGSFPGSCNDDPVNRIPKWVTYRISRRIEVESAGVAVAECC